MSVKKIGKRCWPDERPFALALSHDVDRTYKGFQHIYYIALAAWRRQPRLLKQHMLSFRDQLRGDNPYWNFQRIMKLEDRLGVRSTFFFLHETGRPRLTSFQSWVLFNGRYNIQDSRIVQVIKELERGGWEIGLHGSYYSANDAALLKMEKETLERIVGHKIIGTRQHWLQLTIPETWEIQAQLGLVYDSTIGYSRRTGLRWSTSHPFYPVHPQTRAEIPVLQIPFALMDRPLMSSPDPWAEAQKWIDFVARQGGVLTLDWHQRVFNRREFLPYAQMYERIIRACQEQGAWIARMQDVAQWWVAR
jgi:peptidoglycan/xylan/chitin deacetylase (PgdA/CDA1 family)